MLILTRKRDQHIDVHTPSGDVVRITTVSIGGGQVKLGISAPAEYIILRDNIKDKGVRHGDKAQDDIHSGSGLNVRKVTG